MASLMPLQRWWQSLSLPWRSWRIVGQVSAGDEVPDRLPTKGVILIGKVGRESWAALDCPCRTGHRIMVNLSRDRYPFWRVASRRPLTIIPSIDDITPDRRCHFTVREGRVRWSHHNRRVTE